MKKQPYTIKKGEFRFWSTWLRLEKNSCYLFIYYYLSHDVVLFGSCDLACH